MLLVRLLFALLSPLRLHYRISSHYRVTRYLTPFRSLASNCQPELAQVGARPCLLPFFHLCNQHVLFFSPSWISRHDRQSATHFALWDGCHHGIEPHPELVHVSAPHVQFARYFTRLWCVYVTCLQRTSRQSPSFVVGCNTMHPLVKLLGTF